MNPKRLFLMGLVVGSFVLTVPNSGLYAEDAVNVSYVERGFMRILTAAFQMPRYLIQKTLSEPLGIGTLDGAFTGTYYVIAELSGGLFDIGRGVVPYAKYLLFFL